MPFSTQVRHLPWSYSISSHLLQITLIPKLLILTNSNRSFLPNLSLLLSALLCHFLQLSFFLTSILSQHSCPFLFSPCFLFSLDSMSMISTHSKIRNFFFFCSSFIWLYPHATIAATNEFSFSMSTTEHLYAAGEHYSTRLQASFLWHFISAL